VGGTRLPGWRTTYGSCPATGTSRISRTDRQPGLGHKDPKRPAREALDGYAQNIRAAQAGGEPQQ
jgi:hypothetical protein